MRSSTCNELSTEKFSFVFPTGRQATNTNLPTSQFHSAQTGHPISSDRSSEILYQWLIRIHQAHLFSWPTLVPNILLSSPKKTLNLFAKHLASQHLSYLTIKVYLSAICHLHVIAGNHSEFAAQLTPRPQLVIKGIQRAQATSHTPRVHRPITLGVMQGILNVLSKETPTYHNTMMWAACCTAFFGFLWSSEFYSPVSRTLQSHCTSLTC